MCLLFDRFLLGELTELDLHLDQVFPFDFLPFVELKLELVSLLAVLLALVSQVPLD